MQSEKQSDDGVHIDEQGVEWEFGVPFAGRILSEDQWTKTALKRLPEDGPLHLDELFGRPAPCVLDIGCGNGRFVLSSALRRPDFNHLGIDPLPLVIRYATRRANQRGLSNVRWAVCDGMRFLSQYCTAASLDEIHIYHPQPYQRHEDQHKRLFTPGFFEQIHRVLKPNGLMVLQTDNPAYWKYLDQCVPMVMHWQPHEGSWPTDPQGRTRREIVAMNKGLTIYRGVATRREDCTAEQMSTMCSQLPLPNFEATPKRNPNRWRRPRRRKP